MLRVSLSQINLAHRDRFLCERSPAVAANLKFSQAEFLAMQVFYVEGKDWVCVVLWLGRQRAWLTHACSIQRSVPACV